MKGVLYVLAAYLAGEILSKLLYGFMPASVLGMIVLFIALRMRRVKTADLRIVSRALLDNIMLFFVPVGVGLITSYELIKGQLAAIVLSLIVSTAMVIAVVGLCQQKFGRKI